MVIVVASTTALARKISAGLAGGEPTLACSPRSIHAGAGRGLCDVSEILVDDTAWPLDDRCLETLAPLDATISRRRVA